MCHLLVHSDDKPYRCHVCNKSFSHSDYRKRHMIVHTDDKPYKCPMCDEAFRHWATLNTHFRVHTRERPFTCSLCNKSFTQSSHLQTHKRLVHSNRRPYHCSYCSKTFKSNAYLKVHIRTHTGAKPYSCRHCSCCFKGLYQLNRHLLLSHNEGSWLTCNICQKKFSLRSTLVLHLICHEGAKPYVCSECSLQFRTAGKLKHHQTTVHSDYKRFCCGLCGKVSNTEAMLKRILKIVLKSLDLAVLGCVLSNVST